MAILDFSVSGWHGFGSITKVCFGISVSNFMCMSFAAVGRSLTIVSYVTFKMAALWFWTMFNCNPSIAHCHPLLWGGGILVDHWSSIFFQGHPSNFKVTRDKKSPIFTWIERFQTVTPVWIHRWIEMMHKPWRSIEEVPYCFPMLSIKFQVHRLKNRWFDY